MGAGVCARYAGDGCTCAEGYAAKDDPQGARCEDVDECSTQPCAAGRTCFNTQGSHLCLCPKGQAENTQGECVDPLSCVAGADYTIVEIGRTEDGFGQVLLDDGTCRHLDVAPLKKDAKVTLRALPQRTSKFVGWDHCTPSDVEHCTFEASSKNAPVAHFRLAHNLVFVASVLHGGAFGGAEGADALCTKLARAAGLHGERFVALLRDDEAYGFARLRGSRGWVRPDGRTVLDQIDDPTFRAPPTVDEQRSDVLGDGTIWFAQGRDSCSSFEQGSAGGRSQVVDVRSVRRWREGVVRSCAEQHAFMCFGVGEATPLPDERVKGRLAFISDQGASFLSNTADALAEMDAICKNRACFRGLVPGARDTACEQSHPIRFKALLSTRDRPAASRVNLDGPTWVREDGLPWLANARDLALGKTLTGLVPYTNEPGFPMTVLLGFAEEPGQASMAGSDDCEGYTHYEGMGFAADATHEHLTPTRGSCAAQVICLEE